MREPVTEPLIRMVGISKQFGPVRALNGATFAAYPGEIHVILGENGAGKSSLISVLVGLYQPDEGEIELAGRPVKVRTPADGRRLGLALVPQHVELIPKMTVWENVVLGQEGRGWWLAQGRARAAVRQISDRYGLGLDPDALVSRLSAGEQQKVEILKGLYRQARVLILDEPTTFLTPQESDALFATLTRLAQEGLTVLVVTHKLRDALRFGARLTVMRAGRVEAAVRADAVTERELVAWLMGAERDAGAPASARGSRQPSGAPVLELVDLTTRGAAGRLPLRGARLALRRGEVHGIAGIAGNGQRELAEAILGLAPAAAGQIQLGGQAITHWPVDRRLDAGLFLIPEDRIHEGILPAMPLFENLLLGQHRALFRRFRYDAQAAHRTAAAVIQEYAVKAPDPSVPIAFLSGGNIQKVLVARAVAHASRHAQPVVVAANPTRGLDIRTVRMVHDHLRAIAERGGAVLLLSEDLDELTETCDAVSVIHRGALVARFTGPDYDRYQIGEAMLGRHSGEEGH